MEAAARRKTCESIHLLFGKKLAVPIDAESEFVGPLPNSQVLEVFHNDFQGASSQKPEADS
jgi:hypothetical protein